MAQQVPAHAAGEEQSSRDQDAGNECVVCWERPRWCSCLASKQRISDYRPSLTIGAHAAPRESRLLQGAMP